MTQPVSDAASNSHPVAALNGRTNIPLASGEGSGGRDHSLLRLLSQAKFRSAHLDPPEPIRPRKIEADIKAIMHGGNRSDAFSHRSVDEQVAKAGAAGAQGRWWGEGVFGARQFLPNAALNGRTNIPLASGEGSGGRDHSLLRLFKPSQISVRSPGSAGADQAPED